MIRSSIRLLFPRLRKVTGVGLLGLALPLSVQCHAGEPASEEGSAEVSFSKHIAPIFHQHCVACHNARNPQGRYNMTTFHAIRSMANSGVAIEPGDAGNSLLLQLVEDGSMPYDADPLSDEQISTIRQWIDQGARLDASADAEAPLVRLMPRIPQPEPPRKYIAPVPVSAVAVDPAGLRVASSGYHEVLMWSLPSGELSGRIPNVAERVHGLDFHPDGKRLVEPTERL
ncbi:c-type cytochrome domain-containing protein [Candidatus Laterigemmans baculatus]|nr:c-type cytochrome domain-containing protein [Candidatus Laterigemmans baculatus]